MKKLTLHHLDDVYRLFEKSFVPAELRPYQAFKELFMQGAFDLYGYDDQQQLSGAMIVWEFETFVYIENFAIDQELRGQGLGTKSLEDIKKIIQKPLVLEVEIPFDEESKRRIAFYQRNQFILNDNCTYIQPQLRENAPKVHLQLMSYPMHITQNEYQQIKESLFQKVYQQE